MTLLLAYLFMSITPVVLAAATSFLNHGVRTRDKNAVFSRYFLCFHVYGNTRIIHLNRLVKERYQKTVREEKKIAIKYS